MDTRSSSANRACHIAGGGSVLCCPLPAQHDWDEELIVRRWNALELLGLPEIYEIGRFRPRFRKKCSKNRLF